MTVSKRLRNLKDSSRPPDDFDIMKQALEQAGVVKKRRRVRAGHFVPPKGQQDKPAEGALIATCVLTRHDKGYSFVTVGSKRYFMHQVAIWGGERPNVGDVFQVVVSEKNTRVQQAVRLPVEGA